jgi:tetratricopeptide (TPR) repeat protein
MRPDDLFVRELLFDAFFQKRDYPPAFALIKQLANGQPDDARFQRQLIVTLNNMKRYEDAIPLAAKYIERHGEDFTILDVLKVANFYTGKVAEAVRYGQRGIELRDVEACRLARNMIFSEPTSPPSGANVISFSLWGAQPFYNYGAMINLVLSRSIYPGWRCRFYVGADVMGLSS